MSAPLTIPRHQLTVDDYYAMVDAGILREDSRVELIEGELIEMAPIGLGHMWVLNHLIAILVPQLAGKAILSPQNPVLIPDKNAPQPDIALLRLDCVGRLPAPADVLLVIEVSDTTLTYDRDTKLPLYAAHGIPEAWLFDVGSRTAAIHLDPGPRGYQQVLKPNNTDSVSPSLLPGVGVTLSAVWR